MAVRPSKEASAPLARHAERAAQLGAEEALLRRYACDRSPELRDALVRRYMPLARSLAMRYRRRSESLEDLVQVANLGLVKAIDGFDPDRGRPFAAYAVPTILGELRRHFRDHVWNVRLPRGLQEMTMRVDEATNALTEELGRFPTASQIGERLDVSTEDVLEALEAAHARRTMSLDAPRTADDESSPAVELVEAAEGGYERVEASLAAASAGLDEREWQVLRMRFADELTQQEIGRRLGVSQMQISRISRKALWKLLAAVRGEGDESGAVPPSGARSAADS
jgi:RNA polymerase sigma-B factor